MKKRPWTDTIFEKRLMETKDRMKASPNPEKFARRYLALHKHTFPQIMSILQLTPSEITDRKFDAQGVLDVHQWKQIQGLETI